MSTYVEYYYSNVRRRRQAGVADMYTRLGEGFLCSAMGEQAGQGAGRVVAKMGGLEYSRGCAGL
jgi:hypothetical protein